MKVKIVKNKVAPPFAEAEFDIIYNHGINKEGSILDVGIEHGVVDKKGAWLQFNGELIGQGKDAAQRALVGKAGAGAEDRRTPSWPSGTRRLPLSLSLRLPQVHPRRRWSADSGVVYPISCRHEMGAIICLPIIGLGVSYALLFKAVQVFVWFSQNLHE